MGGYRAVGLQGVLNTVIVSMVFAPAIAGMASFNYGSPAVSRRAFWKNARRADRGDDLMKELCIQNRVIRTQTVPMRICRGNVKNPRRALASDPNPRSSPAPLPTRAFTACYGSEVNPHIRYIRATQALERLRRLTVLYIQLQV